MTEGLSLTDQTFDPPVLAPPKKMRLTLTTKQKQDSCAAILKEKEIYKAAHKAAVTLYALERSKEGGGMTVHQVEEIVKKNPLNQTKQINNSTLRCQSEHQGQVTKEKRACQLHFPGCL